MLDATGMSASLSHLVPAGSLPLVSLLLSRGASLTATASLYDDATPLQLAQQFQFHDAVEAIQRQQQQQQQQQ